MLFVNLKFIFSFYMCIYINIFFNFCLSSYMDEDGKQLVATTDTSNTIELGGGSELIISRRTDKGISTKTFGSREYLRYYRQKPRPTPANNMAITAALTSRFAFNVSLFMGPL